MSNNDNKKRVPLPPGRDQRPGRNIMFIVLAMLLMAGFLLMSSGGDSDKNSKSYSDFLTQVRKTNVKAVTIVSRDIYYRLNNDAGNKKYRAYLPLHDPELMPMLRKYNVNVIGKPKSKNTFLSILGSLLPWLIIIFFVWFLMIRQMQGQGNKAMSFGKSRARLFQAHQKKVTFQDVAGVEEAKQELTEIIEFLVEPGKFRKLGARIPKGVMLVGPPGTGKTLLARAVAGEANVPFFSISGSDFVEMFVGVGASRVRDLFEQGKKKAPCILFIDELDAVGRSRGAGYGGGHDEREQTLNQMLVEMDGFEANEGLIILAATNRPDVLDPALLRPGRFDRQVVVDVPDVKGREKILAVHAKDKPVSKEVKLDLIARGTPGFTGADLANMVNEAALLAARRNKMKIGMLEIEDAKDKVLMGPERRSMVISDSEKLTTAHHEAGHALLGFMLPNADPVHKVTIIPRGRALGLTQSLPIDERHTYSKAYIMDQIVLLLGGRVAEEFLSAGNITNGASNDIERATALARAMVCEWGMSDKLGPLTYGQKEQPIFIGKEIARHKDYSEKVAQMIDAEVRDIVEQSHQMAKNLIRKNYKALENLAQQLLEKEVIDAKELEVLMKKNKVKKTEPFKKTARKTAVKKNASKGRSVRKKG